MTVHGRTAHAPLILSLAACVLLADAAPAQKLMMPGDPITTSPAEVSDQGSFLSSAERPTPFTTNGTLFGDEPWTTNGGGVVYSPSLGSHIRARFNTRSYGQEQGNLDLGTMRHWDQGPGVLFVDGQVTMNEESHVGYNVGVGYRWKTLPLFSFSPDDAKIMGVSFWSDGQHAGGQNFFPQVGASLEFLGDRFDFRANGYAPVGERSQSRDIVTGSTLGFSGNNIAALTAGVTDTALTVGEMEVAARIADLEAWVFTGVYGMRGGAIEEVGGKVGLRGYMTPDLAMSIALTNDDEFDTNAVFNITWFIGRTRAENCPRGTIDDRYREPVIRNDYVALAQREFNGFGSTLTDTADNEAIRVVHVDGNAAAGGDGTFENPFNTLDAITGTMEGDIILAHADSTISGTTTLLNDQTLFGEGGGATLALSTVEVGAINLPETATDAGMGVVPILTGTAGMDTVAVAHNNTVRNLTFDGGANAIVNAATGSNNANLSELTINNMTGNGIQLATVVGADTTDVDGDSDTAETIALLGNVVIDNVTFDSVVGSDIVIDATAASGAADNPGESANITNVTTTRDANPATTASIVIENTSGTTGDTVTIDNYTFSGPGGMAAGATGGALDFDSIAGTIDVLNSTITGGDGPAVNITNDDMVDSSNSISIGSSVSISDVTGTAVNIQDNTSAVAFDASITTGSTVSGGGVIIRRNQASVNFGGTGTNGSIEANNDTAVLIEDSTASINLAGNIDSDGTGDAVVINDTMDPTTDNPPGGSAGVSIVGNITNEQGFALRVNGGDDDVTVVGDITDDGTGVTSNGIDITGRLANSSVLISGTTTINSGGSAGLNITGNNDTARVDIGQIDITTTTGTGLNMDSGELNLTSTTNTITTDGGQAISILGGSSTGANGLTFATVDAMNNTNPNAVVVQNFDGPVTINGGTLTSLAQAVTIEDTDFTLNNATIDSMSDLAIGATYNDNTLRTLSVNTLEANGGALSFTTASDGTATVTLNSVTDSGQVAYMSGGTGTSIFALSNSTMEGNNGFDFDVTGTGNLTGTLTSVSGTGVANTTLDVSSDGNGTLTMNGVDLGGTLAANSTAGSGDLNVTAINSGNTSAFTGVTINDNNNGSVTALLSNTTSTSGVDFDSAGTGDASLTVTGGSYGGSVDVNATNNGNLTANVNGNTTLTAGGVTIAANNSGTFTSNLSGVNAASGGVTINTTSAAANSTSTVIITGGTFGAGIDLDASNNGSYSATINGSPTLTAGGVDILASNTGTFAATLDGVSATTGGVVINTTSAGNATMSITNGAYQGPFDIDANHTGTLNFTMSGITYDTTTNDVGFALLTGTGVTSGGVSITNNNITTGDARAFDLDANGGDLDFLLNNNTFRNNSATAAAAVVDVAGTSIFDTTITNSTFRNDNVAGPLQFSIETSANTPTINLNMSANTANSGAGIGNGTFQLTETAGTFAIFERDDTLNNVGNRNNGTISFPANVIGDFDDLVAPPPTP